VKTFLVTLGNLRRTMPGELKLLTVLEATIGCGIGQGAKCCRFLVAGDQGLECARYSEHHTTLIARGKTMSAQRTPFAPYPACQMKRCACGGGFDTNGDGNCEVCANGKR
jgi:hypothetical protein